MVLELSKQIHNNTNITLFNSNGVLLNNSNNSNKTCFIINGYDISNDIFNANFTFNIEGLISFNEAIKRINNKNLTKNQLYSLYVNKKINNLVDISFGKYYSEINNDSPGRERIDCNQNLLLSNIINIDNYNYFTDYNFVKEKYPHLLIDINNPSLGLTPINNRILKSFIYKNIFLSKNKNFRFSYIVNNRNRNLKRIYPSILGNNSNLCK